MTNPDLDLSQWYTYNEDGLDYRTPDPCLAAPARVQPP